MKVDPAGVGYYGRAVKGQSAGLHRLGVIYGSDPGLGSAYVADWTGKSSGSRWVSLAGTPNLKGVPLVVVSF